MTKNLLLLLLTLFSFSAIHAAKDGNIEWNMSDDGTLTISGKDMPNYKYDGAPWYNDRVKIKTVVIKDGVTSIGNYAFYYCSNLTSVTIPNSVKSIGDYAFDDCSGLTSITIPNSVTSIGNGAFFGCSGLTSITIPNSVTSIERDIFYGCTGLTSITIPNSVKSIGDYAFDGCSGLTSITIPNSVTSIGGHAFEYCSGLTSITIPNSVTSIREYAFGCCSGLTSITIPNSVTSIREYAFKNCSSLTSITIPNSVTSIGYGAFMSCKALSSVTISNSVTSIGGYAFLECSALASITIPNSVTSIGEGAFSICLGLTSVTIGNSVKSIGKEAFRACLRLASITFERSTPPEFGENVFRSVGNSIPVYVSFDSREAYKKALEGFGMSNIKAISISLMDNEAYTQDSQVEGLEVSYTRNFSTNWQALYLPFSLKYEDWKDDFEIAYINAIHQEDNNDDGKIDETILEFVKLNSGSTAPNTPYIIRAKEKGKKTLSTKNATVYPAENNSIDCSTTTATFTFTGIYKAISLAHIAAKTHYIINEEKLIKATATTNNPKAYQWYMTISSRNDDYAEYSNPAKEITISVLDDKEVTGVSELRITNDELPVYNSSVYDMNGRKINENSLKPGMYIKNGKKIIIK